MSGPPPSWLNQNIKHMSKNLTLKYFIIALISTLSSATVMFGQTASADCAVGNNTALTIGTAVTVNSQQTLGNPTLSSTNCGMTSATTSARRDVWYWFTATAASTTVTFTPSGGRDAGLIVYSGCTTTVMGCSNAGTGNTVETTTFNTVVGNTYGVRLLRIASTNEIQGSLVVRVGNDECSGAIALTPASNTTCTSVFTGSVGATQSQTATTGTPDDDVWFSFVATSDVHDILVNPNSMTNAILEVFSGSCGALTQVNQGFVNTGANSGSDEERSFYNLTTGSTYYLRVFSNGNAGSGNQGTFDICVTTPASKCSSITDISACGNAMSYNLNGAGTWDACAAGSTTAGLGQEQIFSFTPNTTGDYLLDLSSWVGTAVSFYYSTTNACDGGLWTYIGRRSSNGTTATFNLTACNTYYFLVDDETTGASSANFTLRRSDNASCQTIVSMTNPTVSTSETGTSFSIDISVLNPSGVSATGVTLSLTSGDASVVGGFTSTTISIPACTSTYTYTMNLSDNATCDDVRTLVFTLSSPTGGEGAGLGANVTLTASISDNEMVYETLFSTGFETGDNSYSINTSSVDAWAVSTTNPINGLRSLVSGASAGAGSNYFTIDTKRTYFAGATTTWKFQVNHFGNEPDNNTKWQVFLASDQHDLWSPVLNGYAVGINPITGPAQDILTLWRIDAGVYIVIATTSIDWGSGLNAVGFQVERNENGLWSLSVDSNGGFDALTEVATGTDETFASTYHFGARYQYAAGNGMKLAFDDFSFAQKGCPETIYTVGSGSPSGTVWSNSTSGTGSVKKPGRFTNVVIQTGHTITLDKTFVCDHLSSQGASTLDCGSYELVIHGNANLGGALAATNNKIVFKGDAAQTFSSASVLNVNNLNVYNTLEKNIGTALTLLSAVNLRGVLSAEKGMVNTNGYLTLISNATVTGSIGEIKTDADVVGTITAQRYLPAALQNFVNLGSPITGLTLGDWNDDLVTTGFPGSDYPTYNFNSIYTYNEALAGDRNVGWVGSTSISNPLLTSKGYMVYMTGAANTLDATGAFQKGNVSIPLSLTNTSSTGDGWNLMLNPYPSEVDWNQVVANSAGVTTYYVYDSQSGSYKSYNGATSTGNASRYIPMGQSFFVGATLQGSSLNYTEAMKTATNAMLERSYVRPNGFVFELARGQFKEELMLLTSPEATADFEDSHDAYRLVGPVAEMHSLYSKSNDNEKLAVDVRQSWGENNIPLYVNAPTKGKYTLTVSALPMSSDITCWIIKDLVTGVELPLEVGMKINANIEANYEGVRWIIEPRSLVSFGSLQADNFTTDNGSIDVVSTNDSWNYTLVNELGTTVSSSASTSSYTGLAAGRYTVAFSSSTGCAAQQVEVVVGSGNLVSAEAIVAAQEAANESSSIVTDELNSIQLGTMSGAWMIQWKDNYEGKVVMTVYNSVGQMVMTESLDGSTRSHIIPNGKFSEGAYVIALSQDDKQLFSGSCLVIE